MQANAFLIEGEGIYKKNAQQRERLMTHRIEEFRSVFGTVPYICSVLWQRIDPFENMNPKSRPVHLLWALHFMYTYATEYVLAKFVGVDEKTFRKWAHPWVKEIGDLSIDVIIWENRFLGDSYFWTFSVDGAHCPIEEPSPFWPGWLSHKYHKAGLAYEVCVGVSTGFIVWVRGPFPAGKWNDLKIFDHDLVTAINIDEEKGVADRGYVGRNRYLVTPWWNRNEIGNRVHERIRARHEQTNSRLKKWKCLGTKFRHDRGLHQSFFNAIACIVQLEIEHGIAFQFEI